MEVKCDSDQIAAYINALRSEYEANLKKFVDLPSVSMEPERAETMLATAAMAIDLLQSQGASARLVKTAGQPVVIGEFHSGADCPTVTVYNHIDVQPADPSEWLTSPFDMQIDDGVYRGRGTTDDKGPALAVLYAASYVHKQGVPINIKFIWELEEEILKNQLGCVIHSTSNSSRKSKSISKFSMRSSSSKMTRL